jgi:hypothetical protein
MEKEIWKDIPNYEGHYQCSNLGRIKSIARKRNISCVRWSSVSSLRERFLASKNIKTGYIRSGLCKCGIKKGYYNHELVAITFLGYQKTNRKICINHINGIRDDNRLVNLEIVTQSYNVKDGFIKGRKIHNKGKTGKNSINAKVIEVFDVNMNYIQTFYGCNEAARELNLKAHNIKSCLYGRTKTYNNYIFKYG